VHGPVFEEDDPRIKNLRIDDYEARLRIAGIEERKERRDKPAYIRRKTYTRKLRRIVGRT
jgi:hypothetical protein